MMMKVYSYKHTAKGGDVTITDTLSTNKNNHNNIKWIRMVNPSEEEMTIVSKTYDLDLNDLHEYLESEEYSRVTKNKKYIEVMFDTVAKKGSVKPVPIYFIITKQTLISIESERFDALHQFSKKLRQNTHKFSLRKTPHHILYYLIDRMNEDFVKTLSRSTRISSIIEKKQEDVSKEDVSLLYNTNVTLTYFNQALLGNIEVLNTLRKMRFIGVNDEIRGHFEDLYYDYLQTLESLKIQREIVSNIFNFHSILNSIKTNELFKKLTALALILVIPTFVTGAFGMNVQLPFETNPAAFNIIMIITLFMVIVCYYIFKKLDWV